MLRVSLALASLLLSSVVTAQCPVGAQRNVPQDSITGPFSFAMPNGFPFYDGTAVQSYNQYYVSDHGLVFLANNGSPAMPTATPLVYTPLPNSLVANGPVIAPFWSDTIPGNSGRFYFEDTPTRTSIVWYNVQSFGIPMPKMRFACVLDSSGAIEFVYGPNLTNNSTASAIGRNAVVGVSSGAPATLPAMTDLSAVPLGATADVTIFDHWITATTFDMAGDHLLFAPSYPGYTWIYTADGGGQLCALLESYGNGCDGLSLTSNSPVLGTNWDLTTTGLHATSGVAFTLFAFGRQVPAIPLSQLGFQAPGCAANVPPAAILTTAVAIAAANQATVNFPLPSSPTFAGIQFTVQSIGLTPNNAAGLAVTNGVEGTIGH